ncbi:MAG: WG repeat-containing protein [Fibrobacteria bacterium]|nr:WG repeat-containing protein [Fibrobacteria bacterium]
MIPKTHTIWIAILLVAFPISHPVVAASCPDRNGEWSAKCFETKDDQRRVKKAHRKRLQFDRNGYETLRIKFPVELVAVNRQGMVVVPNIYFWSDFDYPNDQGGISRFSAPSDSGRSKCGYFIDSTFTVIVPAAYDNCTTFLEGAGMVCNNCIRYCFDPDCHDERFIGGEDRLVFDAGGRLLRKAEPLRLEEVCEEGGTPNVRIEGATRIMTCPSPPGMQVLLPGTIRSD